MLISPFDVFAFLWFLACWVSYALAVDYSPFQHRPVFAAMDRCRDGWMTAMVRRDNRMVDVNIIRNKMRVNSFFASTTIFVIAGLVAIFGAVEEALRLLSDTPYVTPPSCAVSELRVLVLIFVFTYVFSKFSWALRLLHKCSMVLGSLPPPEECGADADLETRRMGRLISRAVRHFNGDFRGYYFGIGTLALFIHP